MSTPRDGQHLCKSCGLCCNGVWFSHVNLEPDELEPARRAGLKVEIIEEKVRSHQPCPLHQNGQCSAYETWRPRACVTFECKLLQDYANGALSLDEALGHVTSARAMAQRIRSELGNIEGGLLGTKFLNSIDDDALPKGNAQPASSPETKLDAVALNLYYDRYFKRPKSEA